MMSGILSRPVMWLLPLSEDLRFRRLTLSCGSAAARCAINSEGGADADYLVPPTLVLDVHKSCGEPARRPLDDGKRRQRVWGQGVSDMTGISV